MDRTNRAAATPARAGGQISQSRAGKSHLLRSVALSVMLAGALGSAVSVLPVVAQDYAFTSVVIEGNRNVDAATILAFARLKQGQGVSAAQVNDAYQGLQKSGLFEEVSVTPQGSKLVIRVKEYPIINAVNFEGNKRLSDEALAELAQSKARRVYSPALAEQDAETLAEAYRAQGRLAATITPRVIRRGDDRVDLAFEVTEGKVVEIERLSFVGNRAFSDRRLRQVLETKQAGLLRQFIKADTLDPSRLELDRQLLRDFYLSRGYVDVQILDASAEVARERDGVFVTFTLQEGQQFTFGEISAASEVEGLDAAEFQAALRLTPGKTYTPSEIESNIARLEALVLKKGLTFVNVEPRITRNEAARTLDVAFTLVRGKKVFVERIDIEGNTTTLDAVIRRQFNTVEGDPLSPREVRLSAERIRALGFFADAQVNTQPGGSPDQVVVNVDVEEQPTGALSFGATYGVNSGIGFTMSLNESNFLGRGQTLGINLGATSGESNTGITFVEPAFLGRNVRFKFAGSYVKTDDSDSTYDTQLISIAPALEFPLGEQSRLELRYTLRQSTIDNVFAGTDSNEDGDYDDEGDSYPASPIIAREEDRGALLSSGFGATWSYDTRKSGLNPKGGVLLRFGMDYAGAGGDVDSVTTSVLALAETRVFNEDVTLRAIFDAGAISMMGGQNSRVTERFFNRQRIRGFEPLGLGPRDLVTDDALGGNMYAVARFEADFPLGLPEEYGVNGGIFADVGSIWGLDDTLGYGGATVDDGFNLRSSIGFSVFWETPIGPLRLNFAKALAKEDYDKDQVFDLTISTKF